MTGNGRCREICVAIDNPCLIRSLVLFAYSLAPLFDYIAQRVGEIGATVLLTCPDMRQARTSQKLFGLTISINQSALHVFSS